MWRKPQIVSKRLSCAPGCGRSLRSPPTPSPHHWRRTARSSDTHRRGPLIAIIEADEPDHVACMAALDQNVIPLVTTWPAFSEATYLLARAGGIESSTGLLAPGADGPARRVGRQVPAVFVLPAPNGPSPPSRGASRRGRTRTSICSASAARFRSLAPRRNWQFCCVYVHNDTETEI